MAFDAVTPGVLYFNNARGKLGSPGAGLWRGVASSPRSRDWRFSRLTNDTFSRSGSLATWAGRPATPSGAANLSVLLYATDDAALLSVDGLDLRPALTLTDVVSMRGSQLPWYEAGRNSIIFSGAAGTGDVMVVGASDPNFRKGFGVFRGVLCDERGRVRWEDWTGQGSGGSAGIAADGFYRAPMYASDLGRVQIVGAPGAESVVLSSHLTGMWSRPLNDAGLAALRASCR